MPSLPLQLMPFSVHLGSLHLSSCQLLPFICRFRWLTEYIKISQKICWDIWGRNRQRNCNCRSILSWCRVCQCRHGSSCPHTQFNWAVLSNQPPTISYPWGWSKHCIKILLLNRCNWWVVWNCAPPSKKGYIQEDEALWIRIGFLYISFIPIRASLHLP